MTMRGCDATDINRNEKGERGKEKRLKILFLLSPFLGNFMAHIFSLNRSNGGVPKLPIHKVNVTVAGLDGDWQDDRKHHGGPTRALCLFSLEQILTLQAEGHPIFPGSTGENITISGLDWSRLQPGTQLRLGGSTEIEITSFASPCETIRDSFNDKRSVRMSEKVNPGWSRVYARVLQEGKLTVGDAVEVIE